VWQQYLEEKMKHSQHILLFIGQRSMSSEHVQQELQIAEQLAKPVLNVRLDWAELNPKIESFVSKYQILDRHSENFGEDLGRAMWRMMNSSESPT
jgi:TIR domain-containing protein